MKTRINKAGNYIIWCDGCKTEHTYYVGTPHPNGCRWVFTGTLESPSFTPSMDLKYGHVAQNISAADCWMCKNGRNFCGRCHFTITNGQVTFHPDTTHALVGQKLELPDLKEI